ncbi:MAG: hypothetical protein WBE37_29510 [Bryobacteraceae bacterium]
MERRELLRVYAGPIATLPGRINMDQQVPLTGMTYAVQEGRN